MIYPIIAYGDPVLKKKAVEIDKDYPGLEKLIADMFETMYDATGVGLAAPQIGKSIRLFIVDGSPFAEDEEDEKQQKVLEGFKKAFINPIILKEDGEEWGFEEGCLSIPGIRAEVQRHPKLTIQYMDENFKQKKETYDGLAARIIQHEYDHIEGVLFVDHLNPLKRKLLSGKLADITKGKVKINYKMRFPVKK